MKTLKCLTSIILSCAILFATHLCHAQDYKNNADAIEDLTNIQNLLEPLNVMNDTFELEHADTEKNHRENTYKSNKDTFKKIIYVDEFDVESGIDRFTKADSYVKQLKNNGEDARIFDTDGKDFVVVYSTHIEAGYTILAVSKFYDNAPHKILQNEYCLILSDKQNNEKGIRQIINDFIKTDKIDIRHIIIKQNGRVTDIRSY